MTFFMIGGFISIAVSVVLLLVFFIAKGEDDNSRASKITMWVSMLFGVAGASLLTIEYSFPQISHPYVPTVYDHFVETYQDRYYQFIKEHTEHLVVDEFIQVKHEELYTFSEYRDTSVTLFKTYVLYDVDEQLYDITFLNRYEYNNDYTYQIIDSFEIN